MQILIAEDNDDLRESLALALETQGYIVEACNNGADALYKAENQRFDVLILDVNMPEVDGFTVAKTLRQQNYTVPILFLTARDSVSDRVHGFNMGGDDYLIKPFALEELYVRIQALVKRSTPVNQNTLAFKDIVLYLDKQTVTVKNTVLTLTAKELQILEYLLLNKNAIISQAQIAQRLWDVENSAESNAIGVHVHNLRKKLQQAQSDAEIKSIRGLGYTLQ